jgi:signal transduction histidine kinase
MKERHHAFEYQFLHKDGTYRWMREEARVICDAEGKPIEVNGYWTDVTEQKRMEEALLRAERLAAVGEMATMVAHDLRNPLTGISGAAYYLRKKLGASADEKLIEILGIIEKDVGYADRIMNDLLEYSGEFELELLEANLRSIIEEALALVSIPSSIRVRNLANDEPKARLDVEKMKRVVRESD